MDEGIITTKQYHIDELIFAEYNPRQLTKDQYQGLKDSITRFGLVDPVIINKHKERDNIIVGGHQRVKIAKDLGYKEVPCVEVNLTPEKERELNIRLNKNTGEWDWDSLANYFDVSDLLEWGFTDDELQFEPELVEGRIDDDEIPEVEEAITKLGDLWLLGEHKVLCGDATKKEDVEQLMEGQKADMVFTDPPYNLNYQSGTWSAERKLKIGKIKNDNMDDADYISWLKSSFTLIKSNINKNIDQYICSDWKVFHLFRESILKSGQELKNLIIWNKEYQTQALNKYANAHEFILFIGSNKYPYKDINVWNCKREFNPDHPTPKPIEIINKAINYSSKDGNLIYDPFIGSGSTLIACEKTNRKCYGMEIDPHYCDVIVKRWEEYTGNKAERIEAASA